MKKSWNIFTLDIKNISKNWVAAVLIGGLVFLPSLYAWLNIYASWDPYAQTNQMKVAIVNEDKGATIREKEIDVGKDLVATLKTSDEMDWQFTNRQQAMDKLEYGDYFAVIVIPENFSGKLSSVISNNPEKADIEYYVNEKINSIAPKITEKGASVIVDKVSREFTATVNGVIFDMFNSLGLELQQDLPDIEKFESYIFELEKGLPGIHNLLKDSLTDLKSAQTIIVKIQKMMPEANQMTADGLDTVNRTIDFLNEAENRLHQMAPSIKKDVEKVQAISQEANSFLKELQAVNLDFTEVNRVKGILNSKIDQAIGKLGALKSDLIDLKALNTVNAASPEKDNPNQSLLDEKLTHAIETTSTTKSFLQEAQKNVQSINGVIEDNQQQVKSTLNKLQQITENTSVNLNRFIKEYDQTIEPTILTEVAKAKMTLQNARNILKEVTTTLPKAQKILNNSATQVTDGKSVIEKALNEFPFINTKVNQLADKIRKMQSKTDLHEVIQLLINNPQAERSFFEEPILLNEHRLFPIENYGTGMTPFYTVLSIWVGCLLLISLLSVEAKHDDLLNDRAIYFGKLFTFLTIGLLQTVIVTIGDIALLGVKVAEPFWFILFGLFISLVFMSIVYTLVSIFGDVGKALAIVMLVLQIAGSGGTYPVDLLPPFFQWINPALPFTYAIDLMRETVGGMVWRRVGIDVLFLTVFSIAILLIGAFLKGFVNQKTEELLKKSKESGLFH
ncbi:YhgE/Pip domain-containing protein [Sporosarcina limicola]|uniref:Membrane protein n=1 Tax=Sporosarcina limicola TaxID=34101 RepID=A0A927MN10_9BACL|nr:YhgE/Pip domain-containing protein [Sporosarcina limicola]MBE1554201.1 putative membrane protein [Sporosarcina limicola]